MIFGCVLVDKIYCVRKIIVVSIVVFCVFVVLVLGFV